eukprot:7388555-Prymnesium_polylepis.1
MARGSYGSVMEGGVRRKLTCDMDARAGRHGSSCGHARLQRLPAMHMSRTAPRPRPPRCRLAARALLS